VGHAHSPISPFPSVGVNAETERSLDLIVKALNQLVGKRLILRDRIRERPASVEDRAVPGHWEGDLLTGSANSHIATLVERQSRFVLLIRLVGKDTTSVVRALSRTVRSLPAGLMASLTWDRGMELAAHKTFTVATDVRRLRRRHRASA
jgi:IS30 family transposase